MRSAKLSAYIHTNINVCTHKCGFIVFGTRRDLIENLDTKRNTK